MQRSADVKTSRRAVGAGIVPLCPGWAVLGDEASQTGEVRVAPTFRSAAMVLDSERAHAGTPGSRSLLDEDKSVFARDLLPTLLSPRSPYATVCSTWWPSLPVFVNALSRWETCRATFCSSQTGLLLLLRLTAPPAAMWCHHEVSEGNHLLVQMLGPINSDHTRRERIATCSISRALDSFEAQTQHHWRSRNDSHFPFTACSCLVSLDICHFDVVRIDFLLLCSCFAKMAHSGGDHRAGLIITTAETLLAAATERTTKGTLSQSVAIVLRERIHTACILWIASSAVLAYVVPRQHATTSRDICDELY